jgi:hypothetical protein
MITSGTFGTFGLFTNYPVFVERRLGAFWGPFWGSVAVCGGRSFEETTTGGVRGRSVRSLGGCRRGPDSLFGGIGSGGVEGLGRYRPLTGPYMPCLAVVSGGCARWLCGACVLVLSHCACPRVPRCPRVCASVACVLPSCTTLA